MDGSGNLVFMVGWADQGTTCQKQLEQREGTPQISLTDTGAWADRRISDNYKRTPYKLAHIMCQHCTRWLQLSARATTSQPNDVITYQRNIKHHHIKPAIPKPHLQCKWNGDLDRDWCPRDFQKTPLASGGPQYLPARNNLSLPLREHHHSPLTGLQAEENAPCPWSYSRWAWLEPWQWDALQWQTKAEN